MSVELKLLFSDKTILNKVIEISSAISTDHNGENVLLIGVLKGSFVFMADIIRHLSINAAIDFVQVSSYGHSKTSSGNCIFQKNLSTNITGREVVIIEDIVDSGNTLHKLLQQLYQEKPKSLKVCSLINKRSRRTRNIHVHYSGFEIDDKFIVGYGLDYNEKYRSLPGIYELIE